MRIRKIFLLIVILILGVILSGCSKESVDLETEKVYSEIRYLESQCISIFNKYINQEYLIENDTVDWNLLKEDYELLSNSMEIVLIDMTSCNIPNESIIELEQHFINLDNYMQNQEEKLFIKEICDMYYLLTNTILESISTEEIVYQSKMCKSNLLYVGYYIVMFQREEALYYLKSFEKHYADLSKNQEYLEDNAYKVNKIFMYVHEIKVFIEIENFKKAKENVQALIQFI